MLISVFPSTIPTIYTLRNPFPPNTDGNAYASNAIPTTRIASNPAIEKRTCFNRQTAANAIIAPKTRPNTICSTTSSIICAPLACPFAIAMNVAVSMYAQGSLLPLSTSRSEAVLYFKFNFFDRRIANTDAASVEPTSEPIRKLSVQSIPNAKWQKTPVSPDVTTTPAVDSRIAFVATDLACSQFVPNPP